MNQITQRNKLDKQLSSYVAFLKIANRSQSVKLCKEIAKLSSRIELIDLMPFPEQSKKLDEYFETKQSKLNFKTIETKSDMRNQKRLPPELRKPIHDEPKDSRNRALELASQHKDIRPVKYLLKN